MTPNEGRLYYKGFFMEETIRVLTLVALTLQVIAAALELIK